MKEIGEISPYLKGREYDGYFAKWIYKFGNGYM